MIPELIAIALASIVVEVIKRYAKTSTLGTLVILLGVSLAGAFIYQLLLYGGYWELAVQILIGASGIYSLIRGVMKAKPVK